MSQITEESLCPVIEESDIIVSDSMYAESAAESSQPSERAAYDFSAPVPVTDPVEDSYFEDALFIGDSRTQGFILYSGLAEATAYADKGLSVDKVFTKEIVHENGADYTVTDALAHHPDEYKKVYLMFGVNELGWNYPNIFQSKYRDVVHAIQQSQPHAIIYVQSILPVSREKSNSSDIYTLERVNLFNDLLKQMAEEEKVCYLNVAEGVSDEEGYLPEDASTDGVHLNKAYCQIWLEYLKNHALTEPPVVLLEDESAS
ncbi:MAG: GDSL-type esterase/lipase family protein [Candidatus Merdivicinus sp.]